MPVPTPINLNDTVPAAPTGRSNVKWQADALNPRNVSGYVLIGGVNAQTANVYAIVASDQGRLVSIANAAAVAVSLPSAATLPGGFWLMAENTGAGTVTITPTTSTIDGAASLALPTSQGAVIYSDGTNYFTMRGLGVSDIRLVGITIDGGGSVISTGVKGAGQVDFAGTIIGWSIVESSGNSGSIAVEVDKKAGTQTVPEIPNTTTDKISASAPVGFTTALAAGVGPAGVSTWTTAVAQWDTIQFNVASASGVKRVTIWLRIQQS